MAGRRKDKGEGRDWISAINLSEETARKKGPWHARGE